MAFFEFVLKGSHGETREHLSQHAEGELRGLKKWRVTRHLAHCEGCRAFYQSFLGMLGTLKTLGGAEPKPKPEIAEDVMKRIRDTEGSGSSG